MTALDVIVEGSKVLFPLSISCWVWMLSKRVDATNKRIDATDALSELRWMRRRR